MAHRSAIPLPRMKLYHRRRRNSYPLKNLELMLCINGDTIIGPMTAENLAIITRFGSSNGPGEWRDLLEESILGDIHKVEFYVRIPEQ